MQVTDFLSIGTTIISFLGSFLISKLTAKSEIKKLDFQFRREDVEILRTHYSDVVATVNTFSSNVTKKNQDAVFKALGNFSAVCPTNMRNIYYLITSKIKEFDFSNEGYYINSSKNADLTKLLTEFESEWVSFNSRKKSS